ncbi:MAG: helix-turn-helix domain-containing protein [Pirellulales bacterium]|nr:helix-turn-helix domain-containing protein [Pirellulales bacterium]
MRLSGRSQTEIAGRLGRAESTISRELRRIRSRNGCWPAAAEAATARSAALRPAAVAVALVAGRNCRAFAAGFSRR